MKLGDTFIFNDEKWVIALDKSTKKHQMFEAWNCKTGARMACFETANFPMDKKSIEMIERTTNSEIFISA